jgi:hypothetical protein
VYLSVFFNGEWRYGGGWEQTSRLVDDVMAGLRGEDETTGAYHPGDDAWFCLAEQRHGGSGPVEGSNLRVAVNKGYGALTWFVTDKFARVGGVDDFVWVSDNVKPPDCDPRVVSDPGYPLFHDPASAQYH